MLPGRRRARQRLFAARVARGLYGAAMHGDTPPDGAGPAIAAFYLNLLGHAVGWPSPRGGASGSPTRWSPICECLGGELRTNVRVERDAERRPGGRRGRAESASRRRP